MSKAKRRVLSGTRPTGKLHIGHLYGAIKNYVALQDEYDCFYTVVDWHALTSEYEDPRIIKESTYEIVADWLAAGLDPNKCTIFIQSHVKQHAELHLLLSMIVPIPWLERVPSYKEQQVQLVDKDLSTYGFLGYPLLQTADIIIYKAECVPVGEDQVPHIELAREIVRRFNRLYGNVFPEPQALLTEIPIIPGTDGRKMSKSYNNTILLSDAENEIKDKVLKMVTDPQRTHRHIPGNPDICPVYYLHKVFSSEQVKSTVNTECRRAGIGCVDCKKMLLEGMLAVLVPFRDKRTKYITDKDYIKDILREGNKKARIVAEQTMEEVRRAMSLIVEL
jgi:tryptophanyl-tRNA synthetase